jgi:hypothetical protein
MENLQVSDAGDKKPAKNYKRFRVRYTATVNITCYVAAPSKDAVEKRIKKGIYWDQFAIDPCERGDILECISEYEEAVITHVRSEDPGDQLLIDAEGNILKQVESKYGHPIHGDVNPMSDEYGYIDPTKHLIDDYSSTVRWKRMLPYDYAERRKMREELSAINPLAVGAFKRAGFVTIEDLAEKTEKELLKQRHVGRKAIKELKVILDELGYKLGGNN